MNVLACDYPEILLKDHKAPCLSLYQPTHRSHPEKTQDVIRYRNLVRKLEVSLKQKFSTREIRVLLDPFKALADDRTFWNHTADGLAVLGAPGFFESTDFSGRLSSWRLLPIPFIPNHSYASCSRRTTTIYLL